MTVFGKIMVFVTTLFALFALSLALWSYSEERDLKAHAQRFSDGITEQQKLIDLEYRQLQAIIQESTQGTRVMPYDPGEPFARETKKTVRQMKEEIVGLDKTANDLKQDWNKAQEELINEVNTLRQVRDDVRVGLAEQKKLRETITPDKTINPQAQPLREVARAAWSAMADSDRRIDEARPTLVSEVMLLMSLQQRFEQLKQRAEQLKQQGTSATETASGR